MRIAVAEKSAYELWLSRNITRAKLVLTKGIDASYDAFVNDKLEVLSGLRPRLLTDVQKLPGARILDGQFYRRAAGDRHAGGRATAAAYLRAFVERCQGLRPWVRRSRATARRV